MGTLGPAKNGTVGFRMSLGLGKDESPDPNPGLGFYRLFLAVSSLPDGSP